VPTPFVSIVIPVRRDTSELSALLESFRFDITSGRVEVVVANGDAADESTMRLRATNPVVQWIDSDPGRGRQMNAGAEAASGRWLLFLHADARLDEQWLTALEKADRSPAIVGGAFRLEIVSSSVMARLIEVGVSARVRWLRLPYGDQAFFVRHDVFEMIGGYQPLPLMEDVDFIRRLGCVGELWFPSVPVRVSARRWQHDGWVWRTVSNVSLTVLYFLRVSPLWLARWYYMPAPQTDGVRLVTRVPLPNGRVSVIVPALNEEESISDVLSEIPNWIDDVIVVDNGSTDATAARARKAGATIVTEPRLGYGRACLAGMHTVSSAEDAIVVFLDADRSDFPEEMIALLEPIRSGVADFVIGDRSGEARPWHARVGTDVCVWLVNWLWGTRYRDLGPFRAIRRCALDQLAMRDQTWGWTLEMQVKAAEEGLVVHEIPVRQRARIGQSKISGTVSGSVRAGARMLYTILSLWWTRRTRLA